MSSPGLPPVLEKLKELRRALFANDGQGPLLRSDIFPGNADYVVKPADKTGRVVVDLATLGHPTLEKVFNPVVNVLSPRNYTVHLTGRTAGGFTAQLHDPTGAKNVVGFSDTVQMGAFEVGDGTEVGQKLNTPDTDVTLLVSIPLPATNTTA